MNLKTQLLAGRTRSHTGYIAHYIGNDAGLFEALLELMFNESAPIPHRASWVVCIVTDRYPDLITPHLGKIIDHLKDFRHTGIHRNLLRQIAEVKIPEEKQGLLFDTCYHWLSSRDEPPAVKVHCMQVLVNIAEDQPELKAELKLVFEELLHHESSAIRSRCQHLYAKL